MLRKTMLMLPLCVTLAACPTAPTKSIAPSLAPVHALVATVDCGEDKADAQLPDYPSGPAVRRADIANMPVEQLRAVALGLYDYSKSQQLWGVHAVGVVEDEHTLRRATRECLAGLRARGLIN